MEKPSSGPHPPSLYQTARAAVAAPGVCLVGEGGRVGRDAARRAEGGPSAFPSRFWLGPCRASMRTIHHPIKLSLHMASLSCVHTPALSKQVCLSRAAAGCMRHTYDTARYARRCAANVCVTPTGHIRCPLAGALGSHTVPLAPPRPCRPRCGTGASCPPVMGARLHGVPRPITNPQHGTRNAPQHSCPPNQLNTFVNARWARRKLFGVACCSAIAPAQGAHCPARSRSSERQHDYDKTSRARHSAQAERPPRRRCGSGPLGSFGGPLRASGGLWGEEGGGGVVPI